MSSRNVELKGEASLAPEAVEQAKAALAKLPVLGPVIWLYGRDATRRYAFVADLDHLVLPPVLLDQCRIYFRSGVPWGYVSWATVSDSVHERLLRGVAKLAPHEWNSGTHPWIVEVLAPFGEPYELIDEVRRSVFPGVSVHRLTYTAGASGIEDLAALGVASSPTKH
jgi:cytolysin-activating lysine-acyltransferase